jgi:DUF1680 family protein
VRSVSLRHGYQKLNQAGKFEILKLDGVMLIEDHGIQLDHNTWESEPCLPYGMDASRTSLVSLSAIPWYALANRGAHVRRVWFPARV